MLETAKALVMMFILVLTWTAYTLVDSFEPELGKEVALKQFDNNDFDAQQVRVYEKTKRTGYMVIFSMPVVTALALYGGNIVSFFKEGSR